ncbi:MAG: hypothetical protein ACRD2L_17605 [Terriglobia bacterium]
MADPVNVPSNDPTEKYRTPDLSPSFDTESKDVSLGASGIPVNNPSNINVTLGGVGTPVNNG